jgi:hypothetical protein
MTEASPPPSEKGEIVRLEVSHAPKGAANVNVQGRREVGALQGFDQPSA